MGINILIFQSIAVDCDNKLNYLIDMTLSSLACGFFFLVFFCNVPKQSGITFSTNLVPKISGI